MMSVASLVFVGCVSHHLLIDVDLAIYLQKSQQ